MNRRLVALGALSIATLWLLSTAYAQFKTGHRPMFGDQFRTKTKPAGASGAAAVPEVHLFVSFNGSGQGPFTTNSLFDGCFTNGNFGYWNINPDPQTRNISTNDGSWPLINDIICGGAQHQASPGGAIRSAKLFLDGAAAFHDARWVFSTGLRQGQMNVTFAFRVEPSVLLSDSIDLVQIEANGEYAVCNLDMSNPTVFRVHSNTNFGTVVNIANIQSNFWYYASMSYNTNTGPTGYTVVELRNGTNGAFIARGGIGHGGKQMAEYVRFGRENHAYTAANAVRFDNFMLRTNMGAAATNWIWQ